MTVRLPPVPVLLVHGLFGSLSAPALLDALADDAPGDRAGAPVAGVLAPDLLGYGVHRDHDVGSLTLADQAEHVARTVAAATAGPVHLVGHSVGGAVALLYAAAHPERVASCVSVEGNLTPKDAFWSAGIARTPLAEIEALIAGYRADVAGWIAAAGVAPTPAALAIARDWLEHQPAATIRAQARAVVAATAEADYLARFERLAARGVPVRLIAGERSRAGWEVPVVIERLAGGVRIVPGAGHLMMLESPAAFASEVRAAIASTIG